MIYVLEIDITLLNRRNKLVILVLIGRATKGIERSIHSVCSFEYQYL